MQKIPLLIAFVLASCSPQAARNIFNQPEPYYPAAPSPAPAPNVVVVIEPPQPTSTPFVYVIQSGDTLSELAEQFKIPQDDLIAANPNINPNSMTVGENLLIPDISASRAAAVTPSPEPVPVTQVVCHPSSDSGLWCFALIQNITPNILENVSAQINLLDANNNAVASQTAFTPLNIIPLETSLPVYIFFPDAQANLTPQVQLLSAMSADVGNARYLTAQLNNIVTKVDWDGFTAHVSGQVILPPESKAATQVRVAAMAYDKNGIIVGLKIWDGGVIPSGGTLPFDFTISSLASAIDRVEFAVEARP